MSIKGIRSQSPAAPTPTVEPLKPTEKPKEVSPQSRSEFSRATQTPSLTDVGRPQRQGIQRTAPQAQAALVTQAQESVPSHTVQSGDTLSEIAARHGLDWRELARHNNLSNPDLIHPGQVIQLPGASSSSATSGPQTPTQGPQTAAPGADAPQGGTAPADPNASTNGPAAVDGTQAPGDTTGGVSLQQLRQIMPNVSEQRAQEMLPHLNRAMNEAQINTPRRQAAFLAQLAHESGEFRYMEEIASGAAYEGRRDLGNTQPGDGRRFKGRGPIQLTGRHNYTEAGRALGLDLAGNPGQVATPEVGFRTSAWYWNSRDLNRFADQGNFDQITRRINGGFNGKADRDRYYQRALQVLGG